MQSVRTRTATNVSHRVVVTALGGVLMLALVACGGATDETGAGSERESGPNAAGEAPTAASQDEELGEVEPLCDEVFSRDQVEEVLGTQFAAPTGDLNFGLGLGYCTWAGDDGTSGIRFDASSTNNDCRSGEVNGEDTEIAGLGERAVWSFDELGGELTVCAFYDADFGVGASVTLFVVADLDEPALRARGEELAAAAMSWLDRNEFGPNQN